MATHTITPDATDTLLNWTVTGAASAHAALQTNDGDTSYVNDNDGSGRVLCTGNADMPHASVINEVRVHTVERAAGADAQPEGTRMEVISSSFFTSYGAVAVQSYAARSAAFATNPQTSQEWTRAQVNLPLVFGNARTSTNGPASRRTQMWATVDYDPARGGFIAVILELAGLGAALGAGLGLEHMARVAAAARARSTVLITPGEYRRALEELRGWKRLRAVLV